MIKINTLIMKHTNVQTNLEENNFGLEQEFRGKLKEAELTSIHLEQEIERVKDEREQSLRGLVEAERQIMLWEKKIQLAKETRSALDPTVGASELREMTKEIHRMRLRYQSMLKLQEKMITEMERSVYRRETIQNKSKTRNKSVGQISLQKTIAELTKKLRQTVGDIKECEKDMATLIHSQERVSQHIDEAQESCVNLEMKENELSSEFDKKTGKKMVVSFDSYNSLRVHGMITKLIFIFSYQHKPYYTKRNANSLKIFVTVNTFTPSKIQINVTKKSTNKKQRFRKWMKSFVH